MACGRDEQILEERPDQAVDLLETSYLVKRSKGRVDAGYEVGPSQVSNALFQCNV